MTTTTAVRALASDTRAVEREQALLRAIGADRLPEAQRELFLNIATRYELDPLLRHVVMIDGKPYITRDGLLHVAHRSGQLDGIEVTAAELREDGYWHADCAVYRKDMGRPFRYHGRYPKAGGNAKFAPEMAVKVAEVMSLRRAFDVSMPTQEERWDIPETDPAPRQPTLAERAAQQAAQVGVTDAPVGAETAPLGDADVQGTPGTVAESEPGKVGEGQSVDTAAGPTYQDVKRAVAALGDHPRPKREGFLDALAVAAPDRYEELELRPTRDWDLTPDQWGRVMGLLGLHYDRA